MSVYYVPSLQPVEYGNFLAIRDGRLPSTVDEWLIAQALLRRELVAGGHHVVGVYVAPADLRRYCRVMRCHADDTALSALATRMGRSRFERNESYERARAKTVIVETSAERRAAFEDGASPGAIEDAAPLRRPWWAFWRRPTT